MADVKEVHNAICEAALALDYFTLFGLQRTCGSADVTKAFAKAALKWHPDKHPPDQKHFYVQVMARVNEAHATLRDASKREAYKRSLEAEEPQEKISKEQETQPSSAAEGKYWKAIHEKYEQAFNDGNIACAVKRYSDAAVAYNEALFQLTEMDRNGRYIIQQVPNSLSVIIQNLKNAMEICLKQEDLPQLAKIYNTAAEYLELVGNFRCFNMAPERKVVAQFFFTAGTAGIQAAKTASEESSILLESPYAIALRLSCGLSDMVGDNIAAKCYAAMAEQSQHNAKNKLDNFKQAINAMKKIPAEHTTDADKLDLGYYTLKYGRVWLEYSLSHQEPWYDIVAQYNEDGIQEILRDAVAKLGGMSDEYQKSGKNDAKTLLVGIQNVYEEISNIIKKVASEKNNKQAEQRKAESEPKPKPKPESKAEPEPKAQTLTTLLKAAELKRPQTIPDAVTKKFLKRKQEDTDEDDAREKLASTNNGTANSTDASTDHVVESRIKRLRP